MATTTKELYLDSQPGGWASRTCPCGLDLGMHPAEDRPTCGDDACDEYLDDHPGWHDETED